MNVTVNNDLFERRGIFELPNDLIRNEPDTVMKVMAKVIVVRCEQMCIKNSIEYHAYSKLFDVSPRGEIIPKYVFIETKNKAGAVTISAKRDG